MNLINIDKEKNTYQISKKGTSQINTMLSGNYINNVEDLRKNEVKKAEIKISAFFAEHNISFQLIDHLIPVLKEDFLDSKICSGLELHKTKCTSIINNIIAPVEVSNTIDVLFKNPF